MATLITINTFIERLNRLEKKDSIPSTTGNAQYSSFKIGNDIISFKRDDSKNPDKIWKIEIKRLYEVYQKCKSIKTNTPLIKYLLGGRQSPTCAILTDIGLYKNGARI